MQSGRYGISFIGLQINFASCRLSGPLHFLACAISFMPWWEKLSRGKEQLTLPILCATRCLALTERACALFVQRVPRSQMKHQNTVYLLAQSLALHWDDLTNVLQDISRSWSNDPNLFSRIPSPSLKLPIKQLKRKYYISGHIELTLEQIPNRSSQHKPVTNTLTYSKCSGLITAWSLAQGRVEYLFSTLAFSETIWYHWL